MRKKRLCLIRIYLIFHSELFLMWSYYQLITPDKFRQFWKWLVTPGHIQPTVVVWDAIFIYVKNQRHWLFSSKNIADRRILQFDWARKTF